MLKIFHNKFCLKYVIHNVTRFLLFFGMYKSSFLKNVLQFMFNICLDGLVVDLYGLLSCNRTSTIETSLFV